MLAETGFCDEEATQFFLWQETRAGITRSLPCPNTTTIVNRTCNPPSIWERVDLTLCIPISSINTVSITVGDGGGGRTLGRSSADMPRKTTGDQ